MIENSLFSFRRCWYLLSYEFTQRYIPSAMSLLAVLGLCLCYQLAFAALGAADFKYETQFGLLHLLGGIWTASKCFGDLQSSEASHSWLMLPASMLEKVTTRITLVTLGFMGSLLVLFSLYMILCSVLLFLLFKVPLHFPMNTFVSLSACYGLFSVQALFILGSLSFPKRPLAGTILAVLSLLLIAFIAMVMFGHIKPGASSIVEASGRLARFFSGIRDEEWQTASSSVEALLGLLVKMMAFPILVLAIYYKAQSLQKHEVKSRS